MTYAYNPAVPSEQAVVNTFIDAMARVYMWMTAGLALTGIVALMVSQNEGLIQAIFGNRLLFWGLIIGQFGIVIGLSWAINKVSPAVALGLFFVFAGTLGLTLSTIFLRYDIGTIGLAFGVTTATFAGLSVVGMTTKRDLTKLGPILLASLFGLIIASVVNWFLNSEALYWIISYAGVLIFMGLTVYDTKKIKQMTFQALSSGDAHAVSRVGIMGALSLYLDFLNLFLFLLRIMGGRR